MEKTVYLVSPNDHEYLRGAGDRMPINILYISSALTANGINNEVFDLNHTPKEKLLERIRTNKPDYVAMSMFTSLSEPQMTKLNEEVKQYGVKTIVGGFHATAKPESLVDKFDAVVVGDGEEAIVDIVQNDLNWIIQKEINVNKYPIPDRSKLIHDYTFNLNGLKATGMVTSRGCPHSCTFCGNIRKTVRSRDMSNIEQELMQIRYSDYQAVHIYDENFGVNKRNANHIGFLMNVMNLNYRIELRANCVTPEFAQMLKETGCISAAVGIESADDYVLQLIKKGERFEQIENGIKMLGNAGVNTKGYFIIGLPGQTYNSVLKTIQKAKELKKHGMVQADFYTFTPYPGSELGDNPRKNGINVLTNNNSEMLHGGKEIHSVIETEWLDQSEIEELTKLARDEFKNG
jgi:anaerobic magnesium-protoporphyrin IX monomethyl ester cyclase